MQLSQYYQASLKSEQVCMQFREYQSKNNGHTICYTDELKKAACELVIEEALSISKVAKQLKISHHSLSSWIKVYRKSDICELKIVSQASVNETDISESSQLNIKKSQICISNNEIILQFPNGNKVTFGGIYAETLFIKLQQEIFSNVATYN